MKSKTIATLAVGAALTAAYAFQSGDNPNRIHQLRELATTTLKIGGKSVPVWIMDDNSKRAEGMMFLSAKDTPLNKGMIFVFNDSSPRSFWNQNVPIDLDIAYIDANYKVIHVTILKKMDTSSVPSNGSAKYVLEMRRGGFKPLGIKVGTKVEGLAKLKAVN